jgi:hypothetical protein
MGGRREGVAERRKLVMRGQKKRTFALDDPRINLLCKKRLERDGD